jgi:transposase InsO family protein
MTASETASETASDTREVDVQHLCKLAGVSRASYYRRFEARAPREADVVLTSRIQRLSLRHKFYGYRRITAVLRRSGMVINAKRVQRLMREDNLIAMRRKPFAPPTSDSRHGFLIVPNLLRGLVPSGPDQIWVADITYIRLREAFAYLAVILDGFSRKVVGWALAPHLDASLAVEALDQALADRKPKPASLIHHSDRGVQYASTEYRQRLAGHDITVSMSRPGNPYDNAKAESFMKTLKAEEVDGRSFKNIEDARRSIAVFIDTIYNTERLHSALGYRPPLEFEANFALAQTS